MRVKVWVQTRQRRYTAVPQELKEMRVTRCTVFVRMVGEDLAWRYTVADLKPGWEDTLEQT